MYPNILSSVLILLVAFLIIGRMLRSHKLTKTAGVALVLFVATTLILWLLLGLNPIPGWLIKSVGGLLHQVRAIKF
jgi:predicted tellurium resistance membrane protein TerC